MRGAGRPADSAALVMVGATSGDDGPLVGQPQDRAVGALAGEPQHLGTQGGEQDRRGGEVGDVERVVDPEQLVLHVDGPGPARAWSSTSRWPAWRPPGRS